MQQQTTSHQRLQPGRWRDPNYRERHSLGRTGTARRAARFQGPIKSNLFDPIIETPLSPGNQMGL